MSLYKKLLALKTRFTPAGSISATNVQGAIEELDSDLSLKATMFPGIDETTPVTISINYSTRVLTVTPTGASFNVLVDGGGVVTKYVKSGAVAFPAFTDTNGVWYFYFDSSGNPISTQVIPTTYTSVAMIYRILWNNTLSGSSKSITEAYEVHANTIPGIDHDWKHQYGAVWVEGGSLAYTALTSGSPNASGVNTCVGMTSLTNLDDNLRYTIENSSGGLSWQQVLGEVAPANITTSNGGLFEIRYQNASKVQFALPATRFPFDWDSVSNLPNYITADGTRTPVTNLYFFVVFLSSIQDPRNGKAVKLVSAPAEYSTITAARAVTWTDIQAAYPVFADKEVRPLYRMIFEYRTTYDIAVKKTVLREVEDIRVARVVATPAAGSMPATSVTVTPTGNVVATNVQDAIAELDSEKLANIVEDTTPQLGGQLDVNGKSLGDGTLELLSFIETAEAVNEFTIKNAATGNAPELQATGGDSNIDLKLVPKGTGVVKGERKMFTVRLIDKDTDLTTGNGKGGEFRISPLRAITVKDVGAYVDTAATGANLLTVDINEGGTSILSTKITLDDGEKTSTAAVTQPAISDTSIASDAIITFDIDQVGNTTAGKGLVVWLEYEYA